MAADDTPKGIATAILGPAMGPGAAASEAPIGELGGEAESDDAETTALGMAADEMISAFETKDRAGLIEALRSLMMLARTGG